MVLPLTAKNVLPSAIWLVSNATCPEQKENFELKAKLVSLFNMTKYWNQAA